RLRVRPRRLRFTRSVWSRRRKREGSADSTVLRSTGRLLLSGPPDDLRLERHAGRLEHPPAHGVDEPEDVAAGRPAAVDEEVGVLLRDDCGSGREPLEAAGVDEPPGVVARGVLENAAGVPLPGGLRGEAAVVVVADSLLDPRRVVGGEPERG